MLEIMPDDRTPPSTMSAEIQELSGSLQALSPAAQARSLASNLIPIVDGCRQIAADLGLRPKRVFLVHRTYPSGTRGLGLPKVISEREILPVPKVIDMSGTSLVMRAAGLGEDGGITIEAISAKYSEDDLLGLTPDLTSVVDPMTGADNVEFFWEVRETRATTPVPQPRRYVPSGVPELRPGGCEWKVTLTKQDGNRERSEVAEPEWGGQ